MQYLVLCVFDGYEPFKKPVIENCHMILECNNEFLIIF
jgi:hypothetical protein